MSRVIRSALLWLLAVALPFEGAMAAAMVACGSHHPGQAAVVAQPTHLADHHHEALEVGHHQTDGAVKTVDASSPEAGIPPSDAAASAQSHQHKGDTSTCSVCASGCTTAVLPASAINLSPLPLVDNLHPPLESLTAVFMTDGPERPPRTIFA